MCVVKTWSDLPLGWMIIQSIAAFVGVYAKV